MRALRWLLVAVVVVGLLVVVVDRVAVRVAQGVVADQVADELARNGVSADPPAVGIEGFPFLTQVLGGRYESVTVELRDVRAEGVALPAVDLVASDVTAALGTLTSGEGEIVADRMEGTATVGYATLAEQLPELEGVRLSGRPDGRLEVVVPAALFGTELTLAGTGELVSGEQGEVRLAAESLTVVEPPDVPPGTEAFVEQFARDLSVPLPIPPLPYGLRVEGVRAAPEGLLVEVSADDVPISG